MGVEGKGRKEEEREEGESRGKVTVKGVLWEESKHVTKRKNPKRYTDEVAHCPTNKEDDTYIRNTLDCM